MTEKHYIDDTFYIEKITPSSPDVRNKMLEIAEVVTDSFYGNSMFNFWFSKVYNFRDEALEHIYKSERNTAKRLARFVESARLRQRFIYSRADRMYLRTVVEPDHWNYGIYDGKHAGGPRLVAYCCIDRPAAYPKLEKSFWTKIYLSWLKATSYVKDFFRFFLLEHPSENPRYLELFGTMRKVNGLPKNEIESIDQLARLDAEQIKTALYPAAFMYYVRIVIVSEFYQRRGLGGKVLTYALNQIDTTEKPVFESEDGKYRQEGEVRAFLDASRNGSGLYYKLGFESTVGGDGENTLNLGEYTITTVPMVLNVEKFQSVENP